jgi:ribosome-binding factor A
LRSLKVVSVTPAPDASRLLVTVEPVPPAGAADPGLVLARLGRASGWLRSEVAAAVTRKRAPVLTFRLAPPAPAAGPPGG